MSKSRVYIVTDPKGQESPVRATSAAQAIRHICGVLFRARVAKVEDALKFGADEVMDATKEHDHV